MSLTPPQWIKSRKRQDRVELVQALRGLIPEWEDPNAEIIDGLASRRQCAAQLRDVLKAHG